MKPCGGFRRAGSGAGGCGDGRAHTSMGAVKVLSPQPLIWLTVAPTMSRMSAHHCSALSLRLRKRRKRMPVVTIFRLPRIW
jgi:hypothetical protein